MTPPIFHGANQSTPAPVKSSLPSSLSLPQLSLKASKSTAAGRSNLGIGAPPSHGPSTSTSSPSLTSSTSTITPSDSINPTLTNRGSLRSFRNRFSFGTRFVSGTKPKDVAPHHAPTRSLQANILSATEDDSFGPVIAIERASEEPPTISMMFNSEPSLALEDLKSTTLSPQQCHSPSLSIEASLGASLSSSTSTIQPRRSPLFERNEASTRATTPLHSPSLPHLPEVDFGDTEFFSAPYSGSTNDAAKPSIDDQRMGDLVGLLKNALETGSTADFIRTLSLTDSQVNSRSNTAIHTPNRTSPTPSIRASKSKGKWSLREMKVAIKRMRSQLTQKTFEDPATARDAVKTLGPAALVDVDAVDALLEREFGVKWTGTKEVEDDTVKPSKNGPQINVVDEEPQRISLDLAALDDDLEQILRSSDNPSPTPSPSTTHSNPSFVASAHPLASSTPAKRHTRSRHIPASVDVKRSKTPPNLPKITSLDTSQVVEPPSPVSSLQPSPIRESSPEPTVMNAHQTRHIRPRTLDSPITPTPPAGVSKVDIAGWRAATSSATRQTQHSVSRSSPGLADSDYFGESRIRSVSRNGWPITPLDQTPPLRPAVRDLETPERPYSSLSNRPLQSRPGVNDLFREERSYGRASLDTQRAEPYRTGLPSAAQRSGHHRVSADWHGARARSPAMSSQLDFDGGRVAAWRSFNDRDTQSVVGSRLYTRRDSDPSAGSPRGYSRTQSSDLASRAGTDVPGHPPSPVSSSSRTLFSTSTSSPQVNASIIQALKDRHEIETEALISALSEVKKENKMLRTENEEYERQVEDLLACIARLERRLKMMERTENLGLGPGRSPSLGMRTTGRITPALTSGRMSPQMYARDRLLELPRSSVQSRSPGPSPLSLPVSLPHVAPPSSDTPSVQPVRRQAKPSLREQAANTSSSSSLFPAFEDHMNVSMLLQEGPVDVPSSSISDSEVDPDMSPPPSPTVALSVVNRSYSQEIEIPNGLASNISPTETSFAFTEVHGSPGSLVLRHEDELHLDELVSFHLDEAEMDALLS